MYLETESLHHLKFCERLKYVHRGIIYHITSLVMSYFINIKIEYIWPCHCRYMHNEASHLNMVVTHHKKPGKWYENITINIGSHRYTYVVLVLDTLSYLNS